MGYKLIDGKLYVVPEEAEIVRMIFTDYLNGMGKIAIIKKLTEMGVKTKRSGEWRESVIGKMLTCEKYIGDLLLQKTFVGNHLTKEQKVNNGHLPMYEVTDAHEPIIDRATFEAVQAEIARRAANRKPSLKQAEEYPFTSKIICEYCGKHYRRKIANSGSKYEKAVWICATFNRLGKAACPSQQIPEDVLLDISEPFTQIKVPGPNLLKIVLPDGTVISKEWEHASRRESWSDEMREQARQKAFEQAERRNLH